MIRRWKVDIKSFYDLYLHIRHKWEKSWVFGVGPGSGQKFSTVRRAELAWVSPHPSPNTGKSVPVTLLGLFMRVLTSKRLKKTWRKKSPSQNIIKKKDLFKQKFSIINLICQRNIISKQIWNFENCSCFVFLRCLYILPTSSKYPKIRNSRWTDFWLFGHLMKICKLRQKLHLRV